MSQDITIPPAALEKMARAYYEAMITHPNSGGAKAPKWYKVSKSDRDALCDVSRAAFEAMVEAWPGMKLTPWWEFTTHKRRVDLVLPLPEKADG